MNLSIKRVFTGVDYRPAMAISWWEIQESDSCAVRLDVSAALQSVLESQGRATSAAREVDVPAGRRASRLGTRASVSFHVASHQKVWPRPTVALPTSNNGN